MRKKLWLLCSIAFLFTACELVEELEEPSIPPMEEENLPLSIEYDRILPGGTFNGKNLGTFSGGYWNENTIRFEAGPEVTADYEIKWTEIRGLDIFGTGSHTVLNNPYAVVYLTEEYNNYSTKTVPEFWISPSNSGKLLQGGAGYSTSNYALGSPYVIQGGYVNITKYSENYISGNFYYKAWMFSPREGINREITEGITGTFENLPYKK